MIITISTFVLLKNNKLYKPLYNQVIIPNEVSQLKGVTSMSKAFWYNKDRKNICGIKIRKLRKEKKLTCKELEIMASLEGYDFLTQNAITKTELGIRFVPDYEVAIFAKLLDTTVEYLLSAD